MRPRQPAITRASLTIPRAQAQGAASRAPAYRRVDPRPYPGPGGGAGDAARGPGQGAREAAIRGDLRVRASVAGARRRGHDRGLPAGEPVGAQNRPLTAVRGSTGAWASAGRACPSMGVSSLDSAGACGLRRLLGDDRAAREGADRAARGDQGDGVDTATTVPSQSVEKVAPGATGDGDGLTSASGPGVMPGSNSPDGASEVSVKRPEQTGGCVGSSALHASATEKLLGVTFGGFESETATRSLNSRRAAA